MDLLKLKYFYIVAKYEHVTKAAEEIHIAQPALTKTIKILEKELGVPLFSKVGRNIYLTDYGKLLKSELDNVFPTIDGISEKIEKLKEESRNTVKLNVMAASTAVMEAVIEYKKQNPSVIFNLIQNVDKPDCDLSVRTDGVFLFDSAKVLKRTIMEEKIFLAVPKNSKFAELKSISLDAVKDEGFVNLAGSRPFRIICDKLCEQAGFKPHIVFESDSVLAVRNIIGAEAGISFWPEYSWGEIDTLDTVLLPINKPVCKRNIFIELHDRQSFSFYAEDFFDYLTEFLNKRRKV